MKKSILKLMIFASMFTLGISTISQASILDRNQLTTVLHDGGIKLNLLSDGNPPGSTKIIVNATEKDYENYMPKREFIAAINAFLVTTADKTILIDTGYGKEIFENLKYLGVKPEEIDIVLLTHMHGDHINGLLLDDKVAFPNAEIYVAKKEFEYWQDKPAVNMLKPYTNKIKFVEPGELENGGNQILPGIFAIAAYGHTPGHTMYLFKDGKEEFLLWGDITHVTPMQIPAPGVFVTYDIDPQQAVATRQKVIDFLAKQDIPVAGAHINYPGMLYIKTDGDSYKYSFVK